MKHQRTFLRCDICGNIVGLVENGGAKLICCGQEMKQLLPNTVDASKEKHVPAVTRGGGGITVEVGSAPHPMTAEHHIAWIMVAQGKHTQRFALEPTGAPAAEFCVGEGDLSVYAYCNLHGLWAVDAE